MNKFLMSAAALCALMAAPSIAEAAVRGYATANVNMRSGPSTGYPAVTVIPYGAPVTINGCMSSVNWCDVSFAGGRGWVSGNYVQASYRSNRVYVEPDYYSGLGIPLVTFDVDRYWGSYYRDRNFYRERDRWRDYDWRANRMPPQRWDNDRDRARDRWIREQERDRARYERDRERARDDWQRDRDRERDRWSAGRADWERERDRARDRDRDRDRQRFEDNNRRDREQERDRARERDRERDRDRDRARERERSRDDQRRPSDGWQPRRDGDACGGPRRCNELN